MSALTSRLQPGPATRWAGHSDAEVLCALAAQDQAALRELHRRYAPLFYALASQAGRADPERDVQNVFLAVDRHAHCHARTHLEACLWLIALARRLLPLEIPTQPRSG